MHIFKYSPRKGTKAAIMLNQIDGNVKEQRSKKLIELNEKNEAEIIILLLSFVPVIEVKSPDDVRRQIKERIDKQIIFNNAIRNSKVLMLGEEASI